MLIKGCGPFTDSLWTSAEHIFKEIISLPFNRQMSSGTLSESSFREYLEQDILYLKEDTRAISITSERAPGGNEKDFFKRLVTAGIGLEEALHNELAGKFGISENIEMNFACREYSSFLISAAVNKTYEESAAALLPCYWIYQNAGLVTAAESAADNPYQVWLDTYSGEEFTAYTKEYIRIIEAASERSGSLLRQKMADAFLTAVKHELYLIKSIN